MPLQRAMAERRSATPAYPASGYLVGISRSRDRRYWPQAQVLKESQSYRSSGSFVSSQAMKPSRDGVLAHVGLKSMVSPPFVRFGFSGADCLYGWHAASRLYIRWLRSVQGPYDVLAERHARHLAERAQTRQDVCKPMHTDPSTIWVICYQRTPQEPFPSRQPNEMLCFHIKHQPEVVHRFSVRLVTEPLCCSIGPKRGHLGCSRCERP